MPDPKTVITLAEEFDAALARKDRAALSRLIKAYGNIYNGLRDKIDALVLQIGNEEMTRGQVAKLDRYRSLIQQVENELTDFSGYLKTELRDTSLSGIAMGTKAARALVGATVGADSGIMAGFNVLPTKTIQRLLGFLDEDGPLYARIKALAGYNAKRVADAILEGVGLGHNPRKIALSIKHEMGGGLTDALRMTRTAQIYSYREASRATYLVNSDVVLGWYWLAAVRSSRTCLSCVAQHGSLHPLSERQSDHYNGRCAQAPAVIGADNPIEQTGEAYFNSLPEAQQRQMMGNDKYEMWKRGDFSFGDLSKISKDEVYGDMRTEASARDLRGRKAVAPSGNDTMSLFSDSRDVDTIRQENISRLASSSGLSERETRGISSVWLTTSNNDPDSLELQRASTRLFPSARLSDWQKNKISNLVLDPDEEHILSSGDKRADAFLEASYKLTQKELGAAGIREVVVYRGVRLSADEFAEMGLTSRANRGITILGNALESWSADKTVADGFANTASGGQRGVVISARFKSNRVVGTGKTGFGGYSVRELIITGGTGDDMADIEVVK